MDVPIPYNLTEDELVIDPSSKGRGYQGTIGFLREILDSHDGVIGDDEELERIMRSTVLLVAKTGAPFAQCLDTAMVWERG